MPTEGRRGSANIIAQTQNRVATTVSSSFPIETSDMIGDGGSFYTTIDNGRTTLHIWEERGKNADPTTCSHCSEVRGSRSVLSTSLAALSSGSASLPRPESTTTIGTSGDATQSQHLCGRQDVEFSQELVQRLMRGNGSIHWEGNEMPLTTAAFGSALHEECKKWRKEANILYSLSRKPAWLPDRQESAISRFVDQILQNRTPDPQLDGIILHYVLPDIPLDDPLGQELEMRLLTKKAAAAQGLLRARLRVAQAAQLSTSSAVKKGFNEDETGFRRS
jgi:hypothetical protein